MAIGYSGNPNSGYEVKRLLSSLAAFLDSQEGRAVAIVGMGYLGRAIAAFLANRSHKIRLVATFDVDLDKIGLSSATCTATRPADAGGAGRQRHRHRHYHRAADHAQHAAEQLVAAGVAGSSTSPPWFCVCTSASTSRTST